MPIAFEELEGSPTVSITGAGTQARRIFRVAWEDWTDFAEQLTGGWRRVNGQFQLVEPLPFPGLPNVVVERVDVAPLDPRNPQGNDIASLIRGTNTFPHAGAKVTAHYRFRPDQETSDAGGTPPKIVPGTILTFSSDLGAEYVSVPGRAWHWNVGGNPKVPDDVNPGVLMPTGDYTLNWDRVANPPWAAIRALRGKVNDAPFYDAPVGKVLFLGARAERKFEFMRNASLWTVEYAFAERAETWNSFFRAETNTWTDVVDGGGIPPYASGDFASLFQFGV